MSTECNCHECTGIRHRQSLIGQIEAATKYATTAPQSSLLQEAREKLNLALEYAPSWLRKEIEDFLKRSKEE